ncbi:MAG: NAD-dependent epimerase/dehydratase family protein, partial [Desulfomonilia bacterium]
STTAYGFHPDNQVPLTEDSPLRGNADFTYAKNKRELEHICASFQESHPDIDMIIVRPCFVVGPGIDNPLSHHLKKKIVLMPAQTAPFQYIHEDDLVEIIHLLLKAKKRGAYNLAADGLMTFDEMIKMLGNWPLKLPFFLMYPLNNIAWLLRLKILTEFPSAGLNMVVYPWYASNEKIKNELGYRFTYTTQEAFADFTRCVHEEEPSGLSWFISRLTNRPSRR